MQPWPCCSEDRKCSKSPSAHHFGTGHGDAAITGTRVLFTVSPASVLIFCHLCLQLGLGVVVYSLLSLLFVPNSNESASSAPGDIK